MSEPKIVLSKYAIALIVLGALVFVMVTVEGLSVGAKGATLEVGAGKTYMAIQDAVNASNPGDTIYVYNGTYYEQVKINKSVNLVGENNQTTIIKGDSVSGTAGINITMGYANVSNLKIDGFFSGIYLSRTSYFQAFTSVCSALTYNTITNCRFGIDSYHNTTVMYNTITNCGSGICLNPPDYPYNNVVSFNTIINSSRSGIWGCTMWGTNITFNTIINSGSCGIAIDHFSSGNNITSNTITNCGGGIGLMNGMYNNIASNTLSNCSSYGICLSCDICGNYGNSIISNTITNCGNTSIYILGSLDNNMAFNTITNSTNGIMLETSWTAIAVLDPTSGGNSSSSLYIIPSLNSTIISNTITNCSNVGIYLISTLNNNITSNTIMNGGVGIFLGGSILPASDNTSIIQASNNNSIVSNTITNSGVGITNGVHSGGGAGYYPVSNNTITSNTIANNSYGIDICGSNNNISSNTITNGSRYGIYIWGTNNSISSNTVTNCSNYGAYYGDYYGIYLTGSNNNITSNTVANCSYCGIYLWGSNNDVTSNTVANCSVYGIYLEYNSNNSVNNTVTSNDIYGNKEYGLYLWGGTGNTAYNNWWGDASGPYNANSNPNGKGNNITDGIPFSPWATAPFNITIVMPPPPINHAPTITSITANRTSVNVSEQVKITVNANDEDNDILAYSYSATGGTLAKSNSTAAWTAPATSGNYTISITVSDGVLTATGSVTISVNKTVQPPPPPENHAPVITGITASKTTAHPGEQVTIIVNAADEDGGALTYNYSASNGAVVGTGSTVTWTAPTVIGDYTITVNVSDGNLTAADSVKVSVVALPANHAPVITRITSDADTVNAGEWAAITVNAADADGDKLAYGYSAAAGEILGKGSSVVWVAPGTAGNYTINITVSDGSLTANGSLTITVIKASSEKPSEESKGGLLPGFEAVLALAAVSIVCAARRKRRNV